MKKIHILSLLLGIVFSSCSEWLTVNPKTEASRDEFFETEDGFQDALTGLYIQLKSEVLYGKAMTMSTLEHIVSFWDITANTTEAALGKFDFSEAGAETAFTQIYNKEYRIIAGANSILGEIDERKEVFTTPGMYEVIKGECLAIRAFCHLDILRLFGPVPDDIPAGNILAYVREVSKTPQLHISYEKYKEYLLADLQEAAGLLSEADPLVSGDEATDDFLKKRFLRTNYYAVKGLQARAHLWFGNTDQAYACAKEIIAAKNKAGQPLFRLGLRSDFENQDPKDYVLSAEHIFALSDFKLEDRYTETFGSAELAKGTNKSLLLSTLYSGLGTDIRYLNLWVDVTGTGTSVGKTKNTLRKYEETKLIPLIRLSEIYFIAIETGPAAEVQSLWAEYLEARNIALPAITDDLPETQKILLKEYRKEFYGEGQMFFRYKLHNSPVADILWIPRNVQPTYVVPLPKSELIQNDEITKP